MSESEREFTIKSYIDFLAEKKLMGSKCKDCGVVYVPVRRLCTSCNNANMEWVEMSGKGKVAAFGGPHWEVGALIFEDKEWIDEKRLSSILDASKKQYRDEKWKWMWVIIGSKSGFDSTTKKFLSKLKIKEIGLMLVDLRRKSIIRGSNLLSKEAAKVIKPSGFEIKDLSLKDIWR